MISWFRESGPQFNCRRKNARNGGPQSCKQEYCRRMHKNGQDDCSAWSPSVKSGHSLVNQRNGSD